jgi:pimeloyl-ACP methyl ester carboxylesterase
MTSVDNAAGSGSYATVNGLEMYYEIHGTGRPLILLHGGVGAIGQMGPEAAEPMKQTPMYQLYSGVAPRPEDWPVLLTKLGQLLAQDYDWSEEVAAMETPTLIVVGDADSVRTAHAVEFFELLGGGKADAGWDGSRMSNARLAILPATTHYDIYFSPTLASTVTPFLDAPMPEAG